MLCNKWIDQWHCQSINHLWHVAQLPAATSASAPSSTRPSSQSCAPPSAAKAGACAEASVDILEFFPDGYAGGLVDGAFWVDSFYYFKQRRGGRPMPYMREMLTRLRSETGYTFMAVCSAGAALVEVANKSATYEELVARLSLRHI